MNPAIRVEGVSKRFRIPLDKSSTLKYRVVHPRSSSRYHDFFALRDISFEVPTGQFLGIIGHNGCGKSTLLKMLARIYVPTTGTVAIEGNVSPFLELGVGFNPELSARENIFLSGALLGLTRADLSNRVDQIIAFADLEEFADQKVKNFSSGMEVRLAFSVAIQANADLLLLDEVLAVGDAQFQTKCMDVFARYMREGRTIVLVTHDLGTVQQLCDRAILLDHGRMIADGPPGEVTSRYRQMVGAQADADGLASAGAEAPGTPATNGSRRRWGSGVVTINGVRFIDDAGAEHHTFRSGQPMTVRVSMVAHQEVGNLNCGVGFFRADGMALAGTNTFLSGVTIPTLPAGSPIEVDYHVDHLELLSGTYRVTVAIESRHPFQTCDWHEQSYEFHVIDESGRIGLFELGGTWAVRVDSLAPAEPRSLRLG